MIYIMRVQYAIVISPIDVLYNPLYLSEMANLRISLVPTAYTYNICNIGYASCEIYHTFYHDFVETLIYIYSIFILRELQVSWRRSSLMAYIVKTKLLYYILSILALSHKNIVLHLLNL